MILDGLLSGSPAMVLDSLSTVRRERLICSRVVLIKYARREVSRGGRCRHCQPIVRSASSTRRFAVGRFGTVSFTNGSGRGGAHCVSEV